jgi:hypothetical protein
MFKLWLEWDLGQDSVIFSSREAAVIWLNTRLEDDGGLLVDFPQGYEDIEDAGLLSLQPVEVI